MTADNAKSSVCVAVIMGSKSDFPTMREAVSILDDLLIGSEVLVVSAHRTPHRLYSFAQSAHERGFKVIIAGAGGAAHLPGMVASLTHLPVIGVPIKSECLNGLDSLLSIAQMPRGTPVATMSIGASGAANAAVFAASILSLSDKDVATRLKDWKCKLTASVATTPY
ncbi:5-(carboxyamino)imidazole ribonucleotide mutase [Candidatus Anaplasma sp. TIGMIC]|uniref:5-(carboxyamino)imidazole ribonucleotide mutase n=1 Tax=Candidatus Anaplasma sp. TIGMIC TaxID=3020713 RepID=UPI00232E757A|nr:5-(carboxyamino)imidazole ribonucleotide mutase [Candidatus Anaplasma sp. TIGMIC]MDB1135728.1 5-(carboxyamino)imidazole ribonucleotide mutase [Candidatus Anaplasma sp. TIGMIC]